MSTHAEEFESLLLEWEAGSLDEAGIERARQLLREHADVRSAYLRHQMIRAALHVESDAGLESFAPESTGDSSPSVSNAVSPGQYDRRFGGAFRINRWFAAAAAVLICILGARLLHLEFFTQSKTEQIALDDAGPPEELGEPSAQGIAIATRLVNVSWGPDQLPLEEGDALTPGRLAIDEGFAQIEFFCGATVILEGPAILEMRSPFLARVVQGRLRAQVPPAARGFTLETNDMKVVDLGTEFGLSVDDEGASVQVFDGEVEVQRPQSEARLLKAGNALVHSANGTLTDSPLDPDRFLGITELESREAAQNNQRLQKWREWSANIRNDRRLIAYYAFDSKSSWRRRLRCDLVPQDNELDGAIVGANQVSGRWSDKGALEFKRPGDRVRVQIPGEFDSLTFACWAKIDSLDRWYNSLFLTDHYNQGEPHWQILDSGQLFFSVRHKADIFSGPVAKKRTHQAVLSPPFWNPSLSGRWLHLATSYDAEAGETVHYLNGEIIHRETIDPELVVKTTRIGAASIGNWSEPTQTESEFAIRNLNGSIDELALFGAVLSADEIKEMYEHGKP